MLRGVDISGHQGGIDLSRVDCDFVVVKATGGVSYKNPHFEEQCDQALALGRRLGVYHFAGDGNPGTAGQEAAHFLESFKAYKGRAIPVLDWEADAVSWPTSWAKEWLETVERETGATPWFYSYSSAVNSHDYSSISRFPLWIAAYYAGYAPMGFQESPPLYGGTGSWPKAAAYQYTSTGQVGHPGNLDLDVFYGSKADWDAQAGGKGAAMPSLRKFVDRMDHYCRVASVGYDQHNRWDVRDGGETDCSALVIWCLNEADFDTGEPPRLRGSNPANGASYTGNMSSYLTKRGWKRLPFAVENAKPGDILLNDSHHVAVVIKGSGPFSTIAQASIDERGQAAGGIAGDQANETNERQIYNYPWDCILRWAGTNDIELEEELMTVKEIWGYMNKRLAKVDAYQLLLNASKPWSYKGQTKRRDGKVEKVGVDAYQLLNDIHEGVAAIEGKLDDISGKLDAR